MALLSSRDESQTRATLDIEVPAEDVERTYGAVARAFARRAALPGFRRGHVPESLVQQRFAAEIREEVLERLLPAALSSAIEEKNLSVLGHPHVENLEWNPPGPIRFSARLDLKPVVDPGDYRGIPVEDVSVEPSEEELSTLIDRIRESHAEFHPIERRAAASGDFAVADIAGRFIEILQPGQNPRTFRDEKLTLEVGHPDSMAEINEALAGAFPGETRSFRKTFADDFANEEFRGKTVDYEVTLVALKEKRLPAFDDDFARAVAQTESAETLREKVRANLRQEKESARRRKFRRDILETILSRTSVPAPEVLVESEAASALRDYARYLAANGMDPKEVDWEKIREDARPGAERRVREYLVLDAVAVREGISITDTELDAEVKRAAVRRGVEASALREQLAKNDGLEALRDEMRLSRALDLLISSARVLPSMEPVERAGVVEELHRPSEG
ncbi:MAG TPA: trigger factor [Thermoanaerobaculia bacterium]|nr:trigger factor [Thermoanaerobaculia bacterium]